MIPFWNAYFIVCGFIAAVGAMLPVLPSAGEQKGHRLLLIIMSFLFLLIGLCIK